ncbi:MAG: flagellar hook-basal body complex protein FliE [Chloracidobacterium sp. CP2_5A]|nr:MAG: flagellar hook-basal body complex protein FliE [Chloracidobacterium sp. CP2_5A]
MGGIEQVMAARAAILARAAAIAGEAGAAAPAAPTGFAALFERALDRAAASARAASAATSAFERGESDDIAQVMLARQVASVEFEATLQLRNRLLGAYRDIMNMPV